MESSASPAPQNIMDFLTDEQAREIEAGWYSILEKIPKNVQVFAIPKYILNEPAQSIMSPHPVMHLPPQPVKEDSVAYEPLMKRLKIDSTKADAALEAAMAPNGLAPEKANLHTLPDDILYQIFKDSCLNEMINFAMICKRLARFMLLPDRPHVQYLALNPQMTFLTRKYEDEGEANRYEIPLCINKYKTNKFSFRNVTNPVVSNIELLMACRYCQGPKAQRSNTPFLSVHFFRHLKTEIYRLGLPTTQGMVMLVVYEVMMTCWKISKEKGSHIARRTDENDPARDIAEAQARFTIWIDDCLKLLNVNYS